jgi:hypothetical protein
MIVDSTSQMTSHLEPSAAILDTKPANALAPNYSESLETVKLG